MFENLRQVLAKLLNVDVSLHAVHAAVQVLDTHIGRSFELHPGQVLPCEEDQGICQTLEVIPSSLDYSVRGVKRHEVEGACNFLRPLLVYVLVALQEFCGQTKIDEIVSVAVFRVVLKSLKDILRFDVPVDIPRLMDIPYSLESLLRHIEDHTQSHFLWARFDESLQRWSLQVHKHPLRGAETYQLGVDETWCPSPQSTSVDVAVDLLLSTHHLCITCVDLKGKPSPRSGVDDLEDNSETASTQLLLHQDVAREFDHFL